MLTRELGNVTLDRLVQSKKEFSPMEVTKEPIVTLVRLSQNMNAFSPILVTL